MNFTVREYVNNSFSLAIEPWFIPIDIFMIICTTLTILITFVFLYILISDKTCHTIPMLLTGNSCLSVLLYACILLSFSIFSLENDLKQIHFQDLFCSYRGYFGYVFCAALDYSFLIQALYRYVIIRYPSRFLWKSFKFQFVLISITWLFSFLHPIVFIFVDQLIYNVDNQICQVPLRLSFYLLYGSFCIYLLPTMILMFIYLKLTLYIKEIHKLVTPINILLRAQQELQMVRRIVSIIAILLTLGLPYVLFMLMSFFKSAPKYHFRLAYIFVDGSLLFVTIAIFQFTDPLKVSLKKRLNGQTNQILPAVI